MWGSIGPLVLKFTTNPVVETVEASEMRTFGQDVNLRLVAVLATFPGSFCLVVVFLAEDCVRVENLVVAGRALAAEAGPSTLSQECIAE
jgi:hypothetical protein